MDDVYVSVDIEADGPLPGRHSMLSVGMVVAGRRTGPMFTEVEANQGLYLELQPISNEYSEDNLRHAHLDRDRLCRTGLAPQIAMARTIDWISSIAGDSARPVMVAYPVSFDWPFLDYYFQTFAAGESPFGVANALDIKSLYVGKAGVAFDQAAKRALPTVLQPRLPHTHHALDDAREQAELFRNIMQWSPPRRPDQISRP